MIIWLDSDTPAPEWDPDALLAEAWFANRMSARAIAAVRSGDAASVQEYYERVLTECGGN